ncbi:hypothetical protein SARC_00774 [Sphaeroforma arctica JP610]|uniref:Glycoside-hydrolase family GH114 TIM-barrel domain-containing protein n=1 Tax=Sphaeroforma arctica JP610 TaxID=667725 RepID=A0A0L0GDY4_9EUKA|nr:hypothetical protein SARC_00774 [Sphaeroforma arctica JP610]KNC87099.1 hypothetical protein SARC_00774 [Sphaeroforma arctica JP610]|eukprot:XP_014161001.1 hypothetical protein SARC_00774 [Sphaeroforma arctica JP610]
MTLTTNIALTALIASAALASPVGNVRRDSAAAPICNLAWSNSGMQAKTDCTGAVVLFSDPLIPDPRVDGQRANGTTGEIMAYLSVGTVNPLYAPDPRLLDYQWQQNLDKNSEGELWGDFWFNPDDLNDHILPIMKDIISSYRALNYTAISTDNAKPSTAVTENDAQAKAYADTERIDPRYVEYLKNIIDFAHSLDMEVALKNPSYYVNEPTVIDEFDAYLVESLFNWYPWDIDVYGSLPYGPKPFWIFQYPGVNGLTNQELHDRMVERNLSKVYLDSEDGYVSYYAF